MAALVLQLLLLLIGVGGAIATAITLSDPVWRFRCVVGFGVMGIVGFGLTVVTYFGTPDLPHFMELWSWLANFVVNVQQRPGFWLIVAFASGLVIGIWLVPLARQGIKSDFRRTPAVKAWLSPLEAIEKFVNPKLLIENARARDRVDSLTKKVCAIQDGVASEHEEAIAQLNDAKFVAEHRRQEVAKNLVGQLCDGRLIAKGFKRNKDGKFQEHETRVPLVNWKVVFLGRVPIDIETRVSATYFGTYHNVSIGKPED